MNELIKYLSNIDYRLLAILSAFFGAISDIMARTILKNINTNIQKQEDHKIKAQDILGLNFLIMTGTLAILSPCFFQIDVKANTMFGMSTTIPIVIFVSLLDLVANYYYFKSFENCEVSIATPILSLSPGFVFILSWIFLGDSFNIIQFFIALCIIFGVILLSMEKINNEAINTSNKLYPPIIASVLFALSAIPTKYLLVNNLINAPTLYEIRGGIIGLFAIMYFGSGIEKLNNNHFKHLFIRSIFVIIQWICLYLSLSLGNAGISITLSRITPVFALIIGITLLTEKITSKKIITAISVIIMVYLINIFG